MDADHYLGIKYNFLDDSVGIEIFCQIGGSDGCEHCVEMRSKNKLTFNAKVVKTSMGGTIVALPCDFSNHDIRLEHRVSETLLKSDPSNH